MGQQLLETSRSSLAYVGIGGFVVAFSMLALFIKERLYINETLVGVVWGILLGPYVAGIFDPRSWSEQHDMITLEVMRIVLATGLFAIGVELPTSYMWKHRRGLTILIIPTMAIGWLTVAGFIRLLFPAVSFVSALAVAACLTPTDPVISAAIVGGKFAIKNVPLDLRRLLAAESAANDGLAYPFLTLAIYFTIDGVSNKALKEWVLIGWLYEVFLGTFLGAVIGLTFSYLMKRLLRNGFINRESFIAQYLALVLFTIGIADVLGVDDLLAAFAAGNAISWDGHFNTHTEDELFFTVIDLVLNCGCFIYIGAWLPFETFNQPELGITPWRLVVLFIAIMGLRRFPSLLLLYRWVPEISDWREALFSGHFGPMGVGAVFVSTLALSKLREYRENGSLSPQAEVLAIYLQPIVAFVVFGSIVIHGLSIPFFSLGKNVHTRTLPYSVTRGGSTQPDWLLWVRRAPADNAIVSAEPGMSEATEVAGPPVTREISRASTAEMTVAEEAPGQGDGSLVTASTAERPGAAIVTPEEQAKAKGVAEAR